MKDKKNTEIRKKSKWRWLLYALIFCILLLIASGLAMRSPRVQQWGIEKISERIENKTGADIDIGSFFIDPFHHLSLTDVHIVEESDTLFSSGTVEVRFAMPIFSLFSRQLSIKDVEMEDVYFHLLQFQDGSGTNVSEFISKLKSDSEKTKDRKARPFELDLKSFSVRNLFFYHENLRRSNIEYYDVEELAIDLKKIDQECREVLIEDIVLRNPKVDITQYTQTGTEKEYVEPEYPFLFLMDRVRLIDGEVKMLNHRAENPIKVPGKMDYSDFKLSDVEIDLRDFSIRDWVFGGSMESLDLTANTGYSLHMETGYSTIDCNRAELNGALLEGDHMRLKDTIVLNYAGYKSFRQLTQRVFLDLRLDDSYLRIDDLIHFVPGLASNPLFVHNQDRMLFYDGSLRGKADALRGYGVNMRLEDLISFRGEFSTRNLTREEPELFNFTIEELNTSTEKLQAISPELNIPDNFKRLGNIRFRGYFDGFAKDFVMSGLGETELGRYRVDMRLDTKGGKADANYSGGLDLIDFQLDGWTGNDDFGRTTFSALVKDGSGLTLESVAAELSADVASIVYKDYEYQDIDAEGIFRQNLFNGKLVIRDRYADLDFSGVVDYLREKPKLDFEAVVNNLDLQKLNFVDYPLSMRGDVQMDILGDHVDNAVGSIEGKNLRIRQFKDSLQLDELSVKLAFEEKDRIAVAQSDLGDVKLNGDFKLSELVNDIKSIVKDQYPDYFNLLGLSFEEGARSRSTLNFSIEFEDTENLTGMLGADNIRFYELEADGVLDAQRPGSTVNIEWDSLIIKNTKFYRTQITQAGQRGENIFGAYVDGIEVAGRELSPLEIDGDIEPDKILFSIQSQRIQKILPRLDLAGELKLDEKDYYLHFDRIFDRRENWNLDPDNAIVIQEEGTEISHLKVSKGNQVLQISKNKDKPALKTFIQGINLEVINEIWPYEPLDFEGTAALDINIDDVSNLNNITFGLHSDTLLINSDDYGRWDAEVDFYNFDNSMRFETQTDNGISKLTSEGIIKFSPITSDDPIRYDLNVWGENLGFKILEYFIPNNINSTYGYFDLDLQISDDQGKPVPSGTATIKDAYTEIDYLKTGFYINDQTITIEEDIYDATGAEIYDENGNKATVIGGILHENMGNLGVDVTISGDDLLVLDTKKGDNALYYGTARGSVIAKFQGPLDAIDMDITGSAQEGSSIVIPITGQVSNSSADQKFYRFVDTVETKEENVESTQLTGVNLSMNLTISNQADMRIIFDERTGDILQGSGTGNLSIELNREGDFTMFGDYQVNRGEYLFTKGFINKRFTVQPGGLIRWTGDPLNANISVDAKYDNLSTSLSIFLQDYLELTSEEVQRQAQNRTPVDLTLQLRGLLLNPDISFDLAFPDLTGELRSLADSRLRVLKADKDALNQQVGALIVSRTFLPSNTGSAGYASGLAASSGFNTVSEFLSNQVSILISGLLAEAVTDINFISNLDFQFDISSYQILEDVDNDNFLSSSEILVNLQPTFLNDRLIFDAGANIVNNSPISSGTFVGEDLVVEYLLSADGKIKLRAFQRSEETVNGRVRRFGAGLYYRTEFNSLKDLFTSSKKKEKKSGKQ